MKMSKKKNNYVEEELTWLEARALEIKKNIDSSPYHNIKDRIKSLNTPKGPTDRMVASIEVQQKAFREALKDYSLLIEAINNLRQIEEEKKDEVRGDTDLNPFEAGEI